MTDLPDSWVRGAPTPIHLPPLPALTTLVIDIGMDRPSPRLTNTLCSIGPAPALTSVIIKYDNLMSLDHPPLGNPWVDVDRWLSGIAKHAKVEGGLSLTLRRRASWEGLLPEFRESGGRVRVDNGGWY